MYQDINFARIYSPSKIKQFDQCPQQFYFSYKDPYLSKKKNELRKLPKNIWPFQTLGGAVHYAITLFYHLEPQNRTPKALKNCLKKAWRSEARKQKKPPLGKWGGFTSLEKERQYYRQGLEMLVNFFQIAEHHPNIKYLPTEDPDNSIDDYINLVTPINDQFNISGKFDLIVQEKNNLLHIIDFKTGQSNFADSFQLRFYKLLAESKFNQPVERASFYFLRSKNKDSFDIEANKNQIKKEITEKIKAIESCQKISPQPSKLCRYCLFIPFCPQKEAVEKLIGQSKEEQNFPDDLPF